VRKSVWLWLLLAVLVVVVLGLIFGGYRTGTKLGAPVPSWSADRLTSAA
jgi:hypothetical protein